MSKNKKINVSKAFEYYSKGLTSKEIAKLLDCSYRTVQNYMSTENWKEKAYRTKKQKALPK